ncbi:MAG: hypothetical protein AAGA29_06900 [Planctomycetota bacterium]
MPAWNNWYHCVVSTYGAWLPGDPRGFRTRKHREHVEGDYKSPPPEGVYAQRHRQSKERMNRDAVRLTEAARKIVLDEIVESADRYDIELLATSVSAMHFHLLGRFPMGRRKPMLNERGLRTSSVDDPVRHLVGQVKQWSSKRLIREGLAEAGVWGKRGKIVPIKDRKHQLNTFNYILRHKQEGAAAWTFRDGLEG